MIPWEEQANAVDNPTVPDEIHFNLPGDRTKVKTIKPTSELPAITQPVIIDGYTQPGSRKNTRATGAINAVPKIQLNGSAAGSDADGLVIQGISDVTIRGLVINRFDRSGIFLTSTDGSDDNRIEGNFVGTNPAGTDALGNGGTGVDIPARGKYRRTQKLSAEASASAGSFGSASSCPEWR